MKNNKQILNSTILVGALTMTSLYSVAETKTINYEVFQPKWYVGAKLGWGYYYQGCENWASSCDNNSSAGGVWGGYNLNDWLSTELGYTYLGQAEAQYSSGTVTGKINSADLFLKGRKYISADWSIFGKVGGVWWNAKNKHAYGTTTSDGADFALGGGLSYQFSPRLSGQIEYQFIPGLGDSKVGGSDHNLLSLGLVYHFGSKTVTLDYKTENKTLDNVAIFQSRIDDTLFEFDSAEIKDSTVLDPFVERLKMNPQAEIVVVGHTDNRGTDQYNEKLSLDRAKAVADYFISQGVEAYRIYSYGLGEKAPIASNDSEKGRALNRRVELSSPGFETHSVHQKTLQK